MDRGVDVRMLSPDAVFSVLKKKTPEKKHFHETRTVVADDRGLARGSQPMFVRPTRVADGLGWRRKKMPQSVDTGKNRD